MFVTLS